MVHFPGAGIGARLTAAVRPAAAAFAVIAMMLFLAMPQCIFAEDITLLWDPNTESDLAGYKMYYGMASGKYGSPIVVGKNTTYTFAGLPPGTYFFAVTAYSTSGQESGFSNEVTTTVSGTISIPVVSIVSPTTAATYNAITETLSLSGTASDSVGIASVTWASSSGGKGTAAGTTAWTIQGVPLQAGANTISVTANNISGSAGSASLIANYTPPSIDTTAPFISISSPTTAGTYSTDKPSLSIGGTASDNVGIGEVSWSNSGGGRGIAAGTNSWSILDIALIAGTNVITVIAKDPAGNTATAVLQVTYTADNIAPAVAIRLPTTSANYATNTAVLDISGTASDNVGVTEVTWSNSAGGSGSATGTTAWSVSGITLAPGSNSITVTGKDASGNKGTAGLSVTFDNKAPVISSVTTTSIKNTTATVTWSTDESSDSQVEWGITTTYGFVSALSSIMTASHLQSLDNLTANTTYHFRVKSRDTAGNLSTSSDYTFRTTNQMDILTGLVAAYGFDEGTGTSTADASGNGRTATLFNGSWSTTAKFGKALSFNGHNSYALAPSGGLPATGAQQTIAYWWRTTQKVTDTESIVALFSNSPRAAVQPGFKDSLIGAMQDGNVWLVAGVQPATKTWHHLAYTFDGRIHNLYLDGQLMSTSTIAPVLASPTMFVIGRAGNSTQYYKGIIDELRIYNRALSLPEIQALMTSAINGK